MEDNLRDTHEEEARRGRRRGDRVQSAGLECGPLVAYTQFNV